MSCSLVRTVSVTCQTMQGLRFTRREGNILNFPQDAFIRLYTSERPNCGQESSQIQSDFKLFKVGCTDTNNRLIFFAACQTTTSLDDEYSKQLCKLAP